MKTLAPLLISLALTAVCLFAAAGRLDWWNAWLLIGLSLTGGLAFTLGRDPELSAERRKVKAGKAWDKTIAAFTVLVGPVATWTTAGLDHRFRWSGPVLFPAVAAAVVAYLLGVALIAWSMRSNKYFSAVVRIQKDRGHRVVAEGPYRFIRHPGYAGTFACILATPLILGSRPALLPAAITAALILLRTALEDQTLRNELDGYTDYSIRVRYQIFPGVW